MDFLVVRVGKISVFLAFAIALWMTLLPIFEKRWSVLWRKAFLSLFFVLLFANALLAVSLLGGNFSVLYVATHSNSAMPAFYKFSALWGGQEGSLLFWTFLLVLWGIFLRAEISRFSALVISSTITFFLVLVNWIKPAFAPAIPPPPDGRELNPLLQHPGMVAHPVLLYLGFTGSVYQFALFASRLEGYQVDFRRWALLCWAVLTLGIVVGGWWAYSELGWGGYWAWDPVENVSFLPWLTLTAFIHTKMVTRALGGLKLTSFLLSFLTFFLAVSGTFLVRTGLFISVHSFVQDPELGLAFLFFLSYLIVLVSFFIWRKWDIFTSSPVLKSFVSREFFIVAGTLVLFAMWVAVFWGTITPVFWEVITGHKVAYGKPFFDKIFAPLSFVLILTLAVGQSVSWKGDSIRKFARPFLLSLSSLALLPFFGKAVFGIWVIAFALFVILDEWVSVLFRSKGIFPPYFTSKRFFALLSHLGFLVVAFGILLSYTKSKSREFEINLGQTVEFEGMKITFADIRRVVGPNWNALEFVFEVQKDGKLVSLPTQKRFYRTWEEPTTEAGIRWGLWEDLYIVVSVAEGDRALVKVFLNRGVFFIWLGTLVTSFAGAVAGLKKVT